MNIEIYVRQQMKINHKKFNNVNFIQDGKMRYQWGQFTKFASRMTFTTINDLNPKILIIGRDWYMDIQNGEWVFHPEIITKEKMNPNAAKKTRRGKNPFKVLKDGVEPIPFVLNRKPAEEIKVEKKEETISE